MKQYSKLRSLASLVGLMAAGCLDAPGEIISVTEEAIEQAPPPHPAPLCQSTTAKAITCNYVGIKTGKLVGDLKLTQAGTGPLAILTYSQDCKYTTDVMEDLGGYCGIREVPDSGRRSCPATLDTVITMTTAGGTAGAPIAAFEAGANLKQQCEFFNRLITGTAPGQGFCCPAPPPPLYILDPIPVIPLPPGWTPTPPTPLPTLPP